MQMMGHPDPEQCGKLAVELCGDLSEKICLDFGCGTGLVGTELKRLGLREVIGVDASAGMIEQAKLKGTYSAFHKMFLG